MALSFGVTMIADGVYGLVQSVEREDQSDTAEAMDAGGDVNSIQTHNRTQTIKADFIYESTELLPATGTDITIDSVKYRLESKSDSEDKSDFRKVSLNGKAWQANTVPA